MKVSELIEKISTSKDKITNDIKDAFLEADLVTVGIIFLVAFIGLIIYLARPKDSDDSPNY